MESCCFGHERVKGVTADDAPLHEEENREEEDREEGDGEEGDGEEEDREEGDRAAIGVGGQIC